jgi:PIN domain nuclease of toxin-antitoxin system
MILFDTHAWLWWHSEPARFSADTAYRIEAASGWLVSPITFWEISTKAAKGKLMLSLPTADWVAASMSERRCALAPLSAQASVRAGQLGLEGFHGDPADRLIVATAMDLGVPLVTADGLIREWAVTHGALSIVW